MTVRQFQEKLPRHLPPRSKVVWYQEVGESSRRGNLASNLPKNYILGISLGGQYTAYCMDISRDKAVPPPTETNSSTATVFSKLRQNPGTETELFLVHSPSSKYLLDNKFTRYPLLISINSYWFYVSVSQVTDHFKRGILAVSQSLPIRSRSSITSSSEREL